MSDTSNIEDLIRFGEDSTLEFKSMQIQGKRVSIPDDKDIADEFAAAANTCGATFLFGIDDKTRQIEGLPPEKLEIAEAWVRNICNDVVKPALVATIQKVSVHNAQGKICCVLRVNVPRSLFVHEGAHGYFYRIGSSRRKMPPEMLARLFQQRSQTRLLCFDEQVVSQASIGDLQSNLFSRFRTELSSSNNQEFLRKLHFIALDTDGVMRPTVSGVLFATEHPELYLPSAYIQAVCYQGTERTANEQLDARDITGPLDMQIIEACRFVARNMRIAAIKNPARLDIPQFAMNAVFEAITNAVAHRDYSIAGAKIRLHIFADRLELFSPGGLPNTMTLDEICERQFARNELICSCLSRCQLTEPIGGVLRSHIMDRRGEGVPVIISATRRLTHREPVFRLLNETELLITIYSVPLNDRKALLELAHQNLVSDGKNLVSDGKNLVSDGKNLVSDGKNLVSNGKNLVSDGKNLVSDGKNLVLGTQKLVFKGVSAKTLQKIARTYELFSEKEFGIAELVSEWPRSSTIALLAKMKTLKLIKPSRCRGRYVFNLIFNYRKQE